MLILFTVELMMNESSLPTLILTLLLCFILVLFFIFRWVVLWYYKIDERINIMNETNNLIRKLIENSDTQ